MPGQSPKRPSSYTVSCRCGSYHIVAVAAFGRAQTCNKCKSSYTVVWKKDPKSGAQSPLVITSARRTLKPPKPGPNPESLIQLACACGYRRKATADELRKLPKCPGCGKPMYVDRPARQRAALPMGSSMPFIEKTRYGLPGKTQPPAAAAKPAMSPRAGQFTEAAQKTPPSTPQPEPARPRGDAKAAPGGKTMLVCSICGDRLLVREVKPGRQVKCLRCDSPMTARAPTPSMLEAAVFDVPPAPPAPDPTPPPAPAKREPRPPPAFVTGPSMDCPCGESIDIRGASPGSVFTCDSCGRSAKMQKAKHPQTLQTIMKPLFDEAPPEHEATVSAEPGALEILCECGEALVVSLRDVGHPVQCPGCSMLLQIENSPGGLKVKPLGRIDEQTWSWQDFA